jgi:hypothetical protein
MTIGAIFANKSRLYEYVRIQKRNNYYLHYSIYIIHCFVLYMAVCVDICCQPVTKEK